MHRSPSSLIRNPLPPRFHQPARRPASTNPLSSSASKPVSPHIGFYQSFGRPIAKTFLGAIFTYQVTYWLWTKLEMDEVKREKSAEVERLERELERTQVGSGRA